MYRVEASARIEAPLAEVYQKTASPHNGPIFIPNLNENFGISTEETQVGQSWSWRYNFLGVDLRGTAEVIGLEVNRRWTLRTQGDASSEWAYSFSPDGEATRVTLAVEYDMPTSKLGQATEAIAQRMNQSACEQTVANLKAWLEP